MEPRHTTGMMVKVRDKDGEPAVDDNRLEKTGDDAGYGRPDLSIV